MNETSFRLHIFVFTFSITLIPYTCSSNLGFVVPYVPLIRLPYIVRIFHWASPHAFTFSFFDFPGLRFFSSCDAYHRTSPHQLQWSLLLLLRSHVRLRWSSSRTYDMTSPILRSTRPLNPSIRKGLACDLCTLFVYYFHDSRITDYFDTQHAIFRLPWFMPRQQPWKVGRSNFITSYGIVPIGMGTPQLDVRLC